MASTGNFKKWWSSVIEARYGQQGMEHIALTVTIVWHIWKARKERMFEAKVKEPMRIITKASNEWLEFQSMDKPRRVLRVSVSRQKETSTVGYGIAAKDGGGCYIAGWGLREKMTGCNIQQEVEAIRYALIKTLEQEWTTITVETTSKELLNQLQRNANRNNLVATLLEDIQAPSILFRMCSFCLVGIENTDLSYIISAQALSRNQDVE
ncbi:uncharacterized protein [Coffea arabica]|uniref:RNase H type-1 domain-containing protein n=1 Tax=Coffea arabica TaxID=13443 RepID=A0A6P6VA89_COFAR|nr:uncharacterized protein LOC113718152 [Coffea arabica]